MHTQFLERENRQNAVNALRVYMMTILHLAHSNSLTHSLTQLMQCRGHKQIQIKRLIRSAQQASKGGYQTSLAVLRRGARPIAIRHSISDHLVPLVLCLAAEQRNDNDGHVVAAHAARVAVRCETVVH